MLFTSAPSWFLSQGLEMWNGFYLFCPFFPLDSHCHQVETVSAPVTIVSQAFSMMPGRAEMVHTDILNEYINSEDRVTQLVTTGMKNIFLNPLNSSFDYFIAVLAEKIHPPESMS